MKILLRFFVSLLCSVLFISPVANAESVPWTPELVMQIKRVSHVRVSPDGKRVAFVVANAVMELEKSEWLSHIYLAAADGTGAVQLTQGEKSSTFPEWSPDGQWIASSRLAATNLTRSRIYGAFGLLAVRQNNSQMRRVASPPCAGLPTDLRSPFACPILQQTNKRRRPRRNGIGA